MLMSENHLINFAVGWAGAGCFVKPLPLSPTGGVVKEALVFGSGEIVVVFISVLLLLITLHFGRASAFRFLVNTDPFLKGLKRRKSPSRSILEELMLSFADH